MDTITLKTSIFGVLDIDEGADLWEDCLIEMEGYDLDVYLCIDGGVVTADTKDTVLELLESLPDMYHRAKDALCAANPGNPVVADFVDFHFESLPVDTLYEALGDLTIDAFFDALQPRTIRLMRCPDRSIGCQMDFSIGRDYSDEVLCVRFDADRRICGVTHEN